MMSSMMSLVSLGAWISFAAAKTTVRPCRLCCQSNDNDSCIYASDASRHETVLHSCCGSSWGKYYCCPQIVENVSFACRGSTGRCKKVASRSQRRSQVDTVETSDEFTYSFKLLMTACFLLYLIRDTFCVGSESTDAALATHGDNKEKLQERESTDAALATHGDNKEKSQEKHQLSCIGCCFD